MQQGSFFQLKLWHQTISYTVENSRVVLINYLSIAQKLSLDDYFFAVLLGNKSFVENPVFFFLPSNGATFVLKMHFWVE